MPKKILTILFATLIIISMVLAACAPPPPPTEEPQVVEVEEVVAEEEEEAEAEVEEEPMLDLSGTTVEFWHVYGEEDDLALLIEPFVEEFNASNEYGITVISVDQVDYDPLEDNFNAGIQSGDLPQLVQAYTSALYNWDTVDLVVDLNQFVYDETFGLTEDEIADIYPGIFSFGLTGTGQRLSWPISQSSNVLVYNFTWAQELGFDSPPTSPEELKEQLCAAADANATDDTPDNDGTGGMVWYPSANNFLDFVFAYGGSALNADGTAYDFNTPAAKAAAMFIIDLKASGCTLETEGYPNPEQANRLALVTMSSTTGLKYYGYAFADAENDDEWGFLAAPGPDGGQGVDSYVQTFGIVKSTPEQELASWIFMKDLTKAETQAAWIELSGYLPTKFSTEEMLVDYAASVPQYASTLALAAAGQGEPETFPAWNSVRRALADAVAQLYAAETAEAVDAILAELNVTAAELVAELE
jgi:ABC-type glycerol-3-phosphate transport system substrate-binding protein